MSLTAKSRALLEFLLKVYLFMVLHYSLHFNHQWPLWIFNKLRFALLRSPSAVIDFRIARLWSVAYSNHEIAADQAVEIFLKGVADRAYMAALRADDRLALILYAAYGGKLQAIRDMRDHPTFLPNFPGLREYISGILAFQDLGIDATDCFVHAARMYREAHLNKREQDVPEYVQHSSNFLSPGQTRAVLEQSAVRRLEGGARRKSVVATTTAVVVSCDARYFEIYSKWFIRQFHSHNNCSLIIRVLCSESEHEKLVSMNHRRLDSSQKTEVVTEVHAPLKSVDFSTARFETALRMLTTADVNVVIMDIDIAPTFSVADLVQSVQSPIGLAIHPTAVVPWGKLAAGLCVFKNHWQSITFLTYLDKYFSALEQHGPEWTLDQTGLEVVRRFMNETGQTVEISDVGDAFVRSLCTQIPAWTRARKMRAKRAPLRLSQVMRSQSLR